ncbi:MAG: shikimate kinase [Desulfobacterales bacterium]|nr:shikimate kinase [Desulfobacterales bacterium]
MSPEPSNPYNIFLIGYRCTGKSSVGKRLADKLDRPFVDTDDLLVVEAGISIKEIVAKNGWEVFRSMESAIMKRVCTPDRRVVATGGGVILDPENVNRMKKSGRSIWLQATSETIKNRMIRDSDTDVSRPALTLKGSIAEIEESLIERNPLYQKVADICVETDAHEIEEICDTIITILSRSQLIDHRS